ncbi:hormogonium polysaccharide biosynthesis protein HpsL [Trichocoleus desertorum AS-A10]|uniref:hormogonium polysaccharide biosynthesis protein HpsL n=1 Tax=Trichocoleus desertorum TaxID=1481672 RepID=UPI0032971BA8
MPKSKLKSKQKALNDEAPPLTMKERLAQKRKAAQARKELVNYTIFALLLCAVAGLCFGVINEDPKPGIGLTVGLLCLSLSFKYPRQAMWGFLIYLPFGGTITYAIGNSPLLQLAKDAFFIPALIGTIQYCRRERLPFLIPKQLMPALGILFAYCLLVLAFINGSQQMAANGAEQPFAMGILGLKVLMGYIPLIVCAYYLIRDKKDLHFLLRLHVVLILACCGLAFIQYTFLKTGRCAGTVASGASLFKASLDARCLVGGSLLYSPEHGQIRLPGTFVAPWQWGWFLISSGFISFAAAFSDPSFVWRNAGLSAMAATFIMSTLSGQRIALALVPVTTVILLILTGQVTNLKRFIPIGAGLGLILSVAMAANPEVVQERITSFQGRWEASPPQAFIMQQFEYAAERSGFLGKGLGRATNAARSLGNSELIETYYPKLLYEIGPLGVLAFLVVAISLTIITFKAYRSVRDRSLRSYGASFWVFILFISFNTYYYPLDVDPVAVYYWFFAGVILKLPELDRQEKLLKEASEDLVSKKKGRRAKKAAATL